MVFSDPVGMPLCIEDQEGNTVWWAERVDPYGAIRVADGSSVEYNIRWPGHYFDPETGLHYNRWRYYDPTLGRYLQSDPIGYGGSPINLYAYAPNPLVQVDLLGLACENDGGESHPKDSGDNDGQEKPPKGKDELNVSPEQLKALCAEKAQTLKDVFSKFDPEGEKSTTLSVGVVDGPEGRKLVVTTRADNQRLHPEVAKAAKAEGIEFRPTEPTIGRSKPRPNPDYDPEAAQARKDAGLKPDSRNNPKNVTDPVIVDPETGEKQPYSKATNGEPPEGTIHHAEQRMENGAAKEGETVLAQAPTKQCCPGCQQNLGDNLSKIPESLQRTK